jgi:hypothetical protein
MTAKKRIGTILFALEAGHIKLIITANKYDKPVRDRNVIERVVINLTNFYEGLKSGGPEQLSPFAPMDPAASRCLIVPSRELRFKH